MTICTEHRYEICYGSRECPACSIQNDLDTAEKLIEDLRTEAEGLKDEIKDLKTLVP